MTATRQHVRGVNPRRHTYAGPGEDVPEGTLIGLRITLADRRDVLIGAARIDLDAGQVAGWQISDGDGWIEGPEWATVEAALDVATDPALLAKLREYANAVARAWQLRREAADLDQRSQLLLDDVMEAPCFGSWQSVWHADGKSGRAVRSRVVGVVCPACGRVEQIQTNRDGWATVPRHVREEQNSDQ